jgi:hypothetical protein
LDKNNHKTDKKENQRRERRGSLEMTRIAIEQWNDAMQIALTNIITSWRT